MVLRLVISTSLSTADIVMFLELILHYSYKTTWYPLGTLILAALLTKYLNSLLKV